MHENFDYMGCLDESFGKSTKKDLLFLFSCSNVFSIHIIKFKQCGGIGDE